MNPHLTTELNRTRTNDLHRTASEARRAHSVRPAGESRHRVLGALRSLIG